MSSNQPFTTHVTGGSAALAPSPTKPIPTEEEGLPINHEDVLRRVGVMDDEDEGVMPALNTTAYGAPSGGMYATNGQYGGGRPTVYGTEYTHQSLSNTSIGATFGEAISPLQSPLDHLQSNGGMPNAVFNHSVTAPPAGNGSFQQQQIGRSHTQFGGSLGVSQFHNHHAHQYNHLNTTDSNSSLMSPTSAAANDSAQNGLQTSAGRAVHPTVSHYMQSAGAGMAGSPPMPLSANNNGSLLTIVPTSDVGHSVGMGASSLAMSGRSSAASHSMNNNMSAGGSVPRVVIPAAPSVVSVSPGSPITGTASPFPSPTNGMRFGDVVASENASPIPTHAAEPHAQPAVQHNDDGLHNLFVANLSNDVDDDQLAGAFGKFGTILSSKVMLDIHTGRSRGFGFVMFDNDASGGAALRALHNSQIGERGQRMSVTKAQTSGQSAITQTTKLYVRNVPVEIPEEVLREHFSHFGTMRRFARKEDTAAKNDLTRQAAARQQTVPPAMVIFLEYATPQEAQNAVKGIHGKKPWGGMAIPLLAKTAETTENRNVRRERQRQKVDEKRPPLTGAGLAIPAHLTAGGAMPTNAMAGSPMANSTMANGMGYPMHQGPMPPNAMTPPMGTTTYSPLMSASLDGSLNATATSALQMGSGHLNASTMANVAMSVTMNPNGSLLGMTGNGNGNVTNGHPFFETIFSGVAPQQVGGGLQVPPNNNGFGSVNGGSSAHVLGSAGQPSSQYSIATGNATVSSTYVPSTMIPGIPTVLSRTASHSQLPNTQSNLHQQAQMARMNSLGQQGMQLAVPLSLANGQGSPAMSRANTGNIGLGLPGNNGQVTTNTTGRAQPFGEASSASVSGYSSNSVGSVGVSSQMGSYYGSLQQQTGMSSPHGSFQQRTPLVAGNGPHTYADPTAMGGAGGVSGSGGTTPHPSIGSLPSSPSLPQQMYMTVQGADGVTRQVVAPGGQPSNGMGQGKDLGGTQQQQAPSRFAHTVVPSSMPFNYGMMPTAGSAASGGMMAEVPEMGRGGSGGSASTIMPHAHSFSVYGAAGQRPQGFGGMPMHQYTAPPAAYSNAGMANYPEIPVQGQHPSMAMGGRVRPTLVSSVRRATA